MALIFRSVFDVADESIGDDALKLFRSWLKSKADRDRVDSASVAAAEFSSDPLVLGPWTIEAVRGESGDLSAFRGRLTELKPDQLLTTTFRVVGSGGRFWSAIDLDREWSDGGDFGASWTPWPPGLVKKILGGYTCSRGPTPLTGNVETLSRESAEDFLGRLVDPKRDVPCVVVTRSDGELKQRVADGAPARASQLANRLAGVAQVVLFEPGAVQDFSALVGGPPWHVHSGAVRTYLPNFLRDGDYPQRHRFIHFSRLDGTPADTAARLAAGRLIEAGAHRKLPESWLRAEEQVPELSRGRPAGDWQELAEALDGEVAVLRDEKENLSTELLEVQSEAREEVAGALMVVEQLQAREQYLRDELKVARPDLDIEGNLRITEETTSLREQCAIVVIEAEAKLPNVVFYDADKVRAGAELLDEHSEPSFARKGWQVLSALNEFADVNAKGGFEGSFLDFCQSGEAKAVQPKWVRMKESETTDQNKRYREARTFKVPIEVDPSGEVYMAAHVALEAGGYPAPRIHFHDDTRGSGKIYVGWFGPHLDNKSKN